MIINHNLGANNAIRQMGINSSNANKSMEKLSSGLRINRAGDDAAGLAISEKMRGQIRGLDQAGANAQDGISMIQTAEGALNETHSILQRMRELAVQSSNDTNTASDRSNIQTEMNQLTSEINRIGNTTEFNTQKLLDGSASAKTVTTSAVGTDLGNVSGITASGVANGNYTLTIANIAAAKDATVSGTVTKNGSNNASGADLTATAGLDAGRANGAVTYSGTVYVTVATGGAAGTATLNFGTTDGGSDLGSGVSFASTGTAINLTGAANGVTFTLANGASANTLTAGDKFTFSVTKADTQQHYEADLGGTKTSFANNSNGVTVVGGNGTISLNSGNVSSVAVGTPETITLAIADGTGKSLQIGANQNQTFGVGINDMRAGALGLTGTGSSFTSVNGVTNGTSNTTAYSGLDVTDATKSGNAITVIDSAIAKVSNERSKLGASQNRLEHTIANLGTSSENLTSAESRIRDVDMAKEMSTFSKNNILSQAAQAMLAQANQQPQQVLQLLR